jgi:hypothetical protein
LQIEQIRPGEALPHSGKERGQCLSALLDFISNEKGSIVGLDFPFSLPAELIESQTWENFILWFREQFQTPQEFKQYFLDAAKGHELRRKTDHDQHTPFSPYNLRLYRQTYYGIRDLLNPVVRNHLAYTLPMQTPLPDKPWIIEICPAATLKREHLYFTYKGKDREQYKKRVFILKKLEMAGMKIAQSNLRSKVLKDSGGDALDSIIAAFATFRALKNLVPFDYTHQSAYNIEGYVYT